jgi:hypothetical protein
MTRKMDSAAINCKTDRRMPNKAPKSAVRLLLGIQMFCFGVFASYTSYDPIQFGSWSLARYEKAWDLALLLSSLGVLLPCLLEVWSFKRIHVKGPQYQPHFLTVMLVKARTPGYAFAGCVWLALWYTGLFDGVITSVDFLGPVYVGFVSWLYYLDAKTQRRVHCGNEKRRPFTAFY